MCGIIGMHAINKAGFFTNDKDALKGMLVVNSLRGAHSTGLMGFHKDPTKNDEVNIIKCVDSPYNMFAWQRSEEFFNRMIAYFGTVVGHGRFATRGEVNADNAHPFEEGHIVLVHNGGISNFHQLKDNKKHEGIEVDSHLVARLIMEEGADAVLPELRGAYTLIWHDTTDGTLHMARNEQRPLFVGENKNALMFASEDITLDWANSRYDLKLDNIESIPTFRHLIFQKGSNIPEVKVYKEKHAYTPPPRYRGYEDRDYSDYEPPINRQKGRTKITSIDKSLAEIEATVNLKLDEIQTFIMDDVNPVSNQSTYMLIQGYNENYPNVEFCISTSLFTEEQIINAVFFSGKVSRIVPVNPDVTVKKVQFRAFLIDPRIDSKEDETEVFGFTDKTRTWVRLEDVGGVVETVSMSAHRMHGLASEGCGWCTGEISEQELKQPEGLGHWSFQGEQSIICTSCFLGYKAKENEKTIN